MASGEMKQRKPQSDTQKTPEDNRLPKRKAKDSNPDPSLKHGALVQLLRMLLLSAWFNSCCIATFVTQLIGSPLYFINKDYYYAYMALTKRSFGILITALTQWGCPTPVRVTGDKSVRGQLQTTEDGRLKSDFPERMVLIANHQVYTDWLYLWWVAYTARMHGHIYIILKESLKYIPIVGQGMKFYGFIFMARKWLEDKPRLQHRLEKLKAKHSGPLSGSQAFDPMWLLIFPEGTNLSENTRKLSDIYGKKQGLVSFKHQILPRSTGLFFCLQQLRGTVDWMYDCTIGYEGPPKGQFPDRYFTLRSTYLQGRPPKSVNMHWRRFAISEIPLDDQKEFETWLTERWAEKDQLLEYFVETGRFPHDDDNQEEAPGSTAGPSYVETEVRLWHWIEIAQVFVVLGIVALLARQLYKIGSFVF